jgi:acylphosphatase
MHSVSITVSGKVQGVWFRKYTCDKANELELKGTVQNLENGDVLIQASGTEAQITALEKWCWVGSPQSDVTQVTLQKLDAISYPDFRILD